MLSQSDLPLRMLDDRAYLEYLGAQDEPWLRVLVAEMQRFEGRRRRELAERLAEPLPCDAPYFKRRAASRVLFRMWNRAGDAAASASAAGGDGRLRPSAVRAALFARRPRTTTRARRSLPRPPRSSASRRTRSRRRCSPICRASGRCARPIRLPTPAEIALHTNLALAQTVVMRAAHVALRVEGNLRPIVRLAKFRGLHLQRRGACARRAAAPRHLGAVLAVPAHAGVRARARGAGATPRVVRALRARGDGAAARAARAGDDGERRSDFPGARAGAVRQPPGRALREGRRAAWRRTGT